jgi:ArsR family transcriptional regulator
MKKLETVLKAVADPNRLRVLNILFQQETCVCDLQSVLGLPQPLLSRHLAYLRNAGLVRDRREGPRVWYSPALDDEVARALGEFLRSVFPLVEAFQVDSAKRRQLTVECLAAQGLKGRPAGRQSKKEMSHGNQSVTVQL